jgi:hypothetical protein
MIANATEAAEQSERTAVARAVQQATREHSSIAPFPLIAAACRAADASRYKTSDAVSHGSVDETLGAVAVTACGSANDSSIAVQPPQDSHTGPRSASRASRLPSPSHDARRSPQTAMRGSVSTSPGASRRASKKRKTAAHAREKRDGVLFASLPLIVPESEQYAALTAPAVKLLVDLMGQYSGNNNGDLCAAWTVMEQRGWRSRDTLANALKELLGSGFVVKTRQGGRHAASLYGITFWALDPNPKLDMLEDDFPRSLWARTPPGAGRMLTRRAC